MDLQYSTYVYMLFSPCPFFAQDIEGPGKIKILLYYTHYTVSRMQKLDPNEKLVFSCLETFTKGNFIPIYHRIKLSH